ncbi:hypothetical protein [Streptomyces sp. enrichment culture]|uniref:hypothetical protein n=1 Tax=Streptomyces sp. enrichment culture TaxID=1795815 RepID=UPI003F5717B4
MVALRAATAAAVLVLAPAAAPALAGDPWGGPAAGPVGEPPGGPDSGPSGPSAAPSAGPERGRVSAVVTPGTVAPGGDLDVRVEGCAGPGGTVRSPVFVADAALSGRGGAGDGGVLYGDTTVRSGTVAGSYALTVVCGGRTHRDAGRLQVDPAPSPTPHAPVRAGGGGAAPPVVEAFAHRLADAPSVAGPMAEAPGAAGQGPGTRHTVIGLVLAAVAAVAVAVRSARRRRGPDAD